MEVSKESIENEVFKKTDIVSFIEQDKSMFRVADFASRSPNVAAYYFLENVNGYHAAKLRVYQDILDVANQIEAGSTSNLRNPLLWDLMNVKYIITDQNVSGNGPLILDMSSANGPQMSQDYPIVYQSPVSKNYIFENKNILPRAFFVASAQKAEGLEILEHLRKADFDPEQIAFVEKDLPAKIQAPGPGAKAEITEKKNEYIKIKATASGNNLLHIGEIYYPVGWKAYIDGKETEIFKTNFAFRSLIVPKGDHEIELIYSSDSFAIGRALSMAINLALVLALVFGFYQIKKKKQNKALEEPKEN
jgi:hypothetical protein